MIMKNIEEHSFYSNYQKDILNVVIATHPIINSNFEPKSIFISSFIIIPFVV